MSDVLKVRGADQLRRTMKRAGVDMQTMKDTHTTVANTVTARAKGSAPVGDTGRLANTVRAGATQRAAIIRAGRKSVPYAGVIHWGWPRRNIVAQPWMSEAATATEPVWVAQYTEAVDKIIDTIEGTRQ